MLVIAPITNSDYVDDFLLDSLIKSNEIVKFKRNRAWVTVGIAPIRANKRDRVFNGTIDWRLMIQYLFVNIARLSS